MSRTFRYALVGCGRVGLKRLGAIPPGRCEVACDIDLRRAKNFVAQIGHGRATVDYQDAVRDASVEIVIAATVNSRLWEVGKAAIQAGKHVLIEKPVGVSSHEIKNLIRLANKHHVWVRPGFNHRFHPALLKAREIVQSGALGDLMFIRGRYGHGGRKDYEREWRADPKISGGGELMDQGVHLIDLARWFLGDFHTTEGIARTFFWKMKVDDNAFLNLQTRQGQVAWLHVSCTEWKNLFSFEIYGRRGKLHIEGLGGTYGLERLYYYKMLSPGRAPATKIFEFSRDDNSWTLELRTFEKDIQYRREPHPNLNDAWAVICHVEEIYRKCGYR